MVPGILKLRSLIWRDIKSVNNILLWILIAGWLLHWSRRGGVCCAPTYSNVSDWVALAGRLPTDGCAQRVQPSLCVVRRHAPASLLRNQARLLLLPWSGESLPPPAPGTCCTCSSPRTTMQHCAHISKLHYFYNDWYFVVVHWGNLSEPARDNAVIVNFKA